MDSLANYAVKDPVPEAVPTHRKPKGRGHERRAEILDAAARMFVELGFENVSTRRIAQEVGISQTSLYVYFPNKAALLEILCDQCFSKLMKLARTPEARAGTPVERLRWLLRAYVRFGIAHPDQYRLSFMMRQPHASRTAGDSASLLDPAFPRESLAPGMQCFLELQDRVDELARAGQLGVERRLAAQAVWAAAHGLVSLLVTLPAFPWGDRDTLIDAAIEVQLQGLIPPPREFKI